MTPDDLKTRRLEDLALAIECARDLLESVGETTVTQVADLIVGSGLDWPGVQSLWQRNDVATKRQVRGLARRALLELESTGDWTSRIEQRNGYQERVWSEVEP